MEAGARTAATKDLRRLGDTAHAVQHHGQEAIKSQSIKSQFLGGMNEGESWGLRKWLSKHGAGLQACTDLECILKEGRNKLDKDAQHLLAATIRPMAQLVLQQLQSDTPEGYKQHSTAHPHMPYFHRLEGALRSIARFCQEEDDTICLDESDDEDVVVVVQTKKRARGPEVDSKPKATRKPKARKHK